MKLLNYRKSTLHSISFPLVSLLSFILFLCHFYFFYSSRPCCHCQLSLYISMCAYLSIVPPAPLSSVYHKERGGRLIQVIYIV